MASRVVELTTVAVHHAEDVVEQVADTLRKVNPIVLVLGAIGGTVVFLRVRRLYRKSEDPVVKRLMGYGFSLFRRLPMVRREIERKLAPEKKALHVLIHKDDTDRVFHGELPSRGLSSDAVLKLADGYEAYGKFDVEHGRVSGAVYTDRKNEHIQLLTKIYSKYAYSNPLHPDVFPGARKMEAEVIRMVLNLYNAPEDATGSLTTGGTESIVMACFAYRNRAIAAGISDPVILCPITAHAAFDKAAHLFGIRIRHVAVDENNRVILKQLERAIDSDVCMIVGSAPNFPSGTIDPIPEIAELGARYGIPVHVDACLGGFLLPFTNEAGFTLKPFDFRNKGVMSISCDTHKYGCTPKGSSIVMYRSNELQHFQYFSIPEWTGGIYATPTICGSRAGSSAAAAWATLLSFGRLEYVERCRAIVSHARKIAEGIRTMDGLELHGVPDLSVVAFKAKECNIYAVGDKLTKRGWALNTLQNPDAIHICLTINHASQSVVDAFLSDLKQSVDEVMSSADRGKSSSTAALYGLAAQIPDKSLVDEMTHAFLDACYAKPPIVTVDHAAAAGDH